MSEPSELKKGSLKGLDRPFLAQDSDVQTVFDKIGSLDLESCHIDMIESSVAETLTHLAIENKGAENAFCNEYDIFPEGVRGILDLLRQDKATVGDRLAILKSNIAPDVNSLELGRVHHFMQSDEKTLDEEREIAHLIGKGISSVELESKSPELHKIRVHDTVTEKGKVTGMIISIKMTIAEDQNLLVRHRLKAYVPIEALESQIIPHEGYGGSKEEQILHMQRRLGRVKSNTPEPHLEIGSMLSNDLVDAVLKNPDKWLTSIYYGCRRRGEDYGKKDPKKEFVRLGNLTLRTI